MKKKKKKNQKDGAKTTEIRKKSEDCIDYLLDKAKHGDGLTPEEVTYVAERIKAFNPDEKYLPTLLFILGLSCATQHRELIESFLYYLTDPTISAMALTVLCDDWGDGQRYVTELKTFIRGVPWDKEKDVHFAAVQCTGDFS